MTATRYFTIVNPSAGGGRCGRCAHDALRELRTHGLSLEVHHTSGPGHASELAREGFADGHRHFLSVGGDGTSYEVINGIFPNESGERPTIAMLPLGTGNSFLRDFALDSAERAMRAIVGGRTRGCDVVRVTHRDGALHYINILSVGFSAEAGELMNRRFKTLGPPGYVAAVLLTAARLKRPVFPIRVDDGELDARPCVLLSFSNSRFTAGTMMMAPRADVTDGSLDVIRIGAMGRLSFVQSFPSIFAGRHVDHNDVEQARAKSVALELAEPIDVMVDGEIMRIALERLEVLPAAVEVVA